MFIAIFIQEKPHQGGGVKFRGCDNQEHHYHVMMLPSGTSLYDNDVTITSFSEKDVTFGNIVIW